MRDLIDTSPSHLKELGFDTSELEKDIVAIDEGRLTIPTMSAVKSYGGEEIMVYIGELG